MPHRSLRPPLLALALATLIGAASASGPPPPAADQEVENIGYRLAVAAVGFCAHPVPLPGLTISDRSQYAPADQPAAWTGATAGDLPRVLAVARGSPAERAGIRAGDGLVAIHGARVPPVKARAPTFDRVETTLRMLDAAAAPDGTLDLALDREGVPMTVRVTLERGCSSHFITAQSDGIRAGADGEYVQVTTGAVRFAGGGDALAVVLAHEFAHNLLGHRARLTAAGVDRGIFGQFGRSARLVRDTEDEADRLGVYLMDRAGYPPHAAVAFWSRYRQTHPLAFLDAPTHSSPAERIATIAAEIARIERMKAAGEPPAPDFATAAGR